MVADWWVIWNIFIFPFSWECHHPNWRTHIFRRGGSTTNQISKRQPRTWDRNCAQDVREKESLREEFQWHWVASSSELCEMQSWHKHHMNKVRRIKPDILGGPTILGRILIKFLWTPDVARSSMYIHLSYMLSWMLLSVFLKWSLWSWQFVVVHLGRSLSQVFEAREVGCHPEYTSSLNYENWMVLLENIVMNQWI